MKLTILFGVLLCIAIANAGKMQRREAEADSEDSLDVVRRARDRSASQMRHKRRSWSSSYGYDYPPPPNPFPYDRRRDYNNQDYLPEILRLLDEISAYVKRPTPPPPPQPIYIPYAVPYPIPQHCKCNKPSQNKTETPGLENRFSDMEDSRQNWGLVDSSEGDDDEGDGSRPISFTPIQANRPSKRPMQKVDHGSVQAGMNQAPAAPKIVPSRCDVFALSCCTGTVQQKRQCFINVGCPNTFNNGEVCSQDRLLEIIDAYSQAYAPTH